MISRVFDDLGRPSARPLPGEMTVSRRSVRSAAGVLACALALPIGLLASACEPAPPRPANDDFGAAVRLPSTTQGQFAGTTLGGTLQPGESRNWGPTSVWYRWVAPTSGIVDLTGGNPLGAYADVYTGATYRTLRPVPTSILSATNQFAVTAGTTYTLRVSSQFGGSFVLHWDTKTTPANDNRQRAAALTGATGSLVVDATAATRQPSDPTIDGQRVPASVWYRWTAPTSGRYSFGTAGSRSSAAIGAYTDDGALTRLDESAGGCGSSLGGLFSSSGSSAAAIGFDAQAGRSYLLMLGTLPEDYGFTAGAPLPFPQFGDRMQLNWRLLPDSPTASGNDAFSAASRLTGTHGTVEGTTAAATAEAGEPAHAGARAQSSVWFTITPRVTADYLFQASPQDSDGCYSRIGVYTGAAVNRLTAVPPSSRPAPLAQLFTAQMPDAAGDPDLETPEALVGRRVHLVAGRTYHIAVDRKSEPSTFSLHWDIPQAVPAVRSVTTGNGSIGVIWSPPAATAGSTRSGYFVTAVPVGTDDEDYDGSYVGDVSVPVTSSFTTVRGLTNGKAYRLIVAAVNDAGPGDLYVSRPVTPRR